MWIIFALLAGVSAAIVTTLSKAGLKKVDPSLAFAIQAVFIIIVSWITVFSQKLSGQIPAIEGRSWVYLIAAGIVTTISSLLTFQALKLADASQVNPLGSLSLVFSVILAAFFLKEKITWQIVAGVLMMIGGAILIATVKKEA